MPKGWRLFLASYMLWPGINLGHQTSISKFFSIYRPVYNKTGVMAFTVRTKLQFITFKQIYSNNKNCFTEFFYVSSTWESNLPKALLED